jgi:hypothetical protein
METPSIVSDWQKARRSENQGACVEVARAELPQADDHNEPR